MGIQSRKLRSFGALIALAAMLPACGNGGGGGGGSVSAVTPTPTVTPVPTPTPTPTAVAGCSLQERQNWAFAQLQEWYLFPETLPASLNPAPYYTLDAYVDALTATARSQRRDRYFTYVTSIAEENAYYASGSSAGYGFRLVFDPNTNRLFVSESFENTPAFAANIDRGGEIVGIGTTGGTVRTVSAIVAAEGTAGLNAALGPNTTGTARVFRVRDLGATTTRDVTVTKADFELAPVSSRYGAKVIVDGGRKVGYVNLRTFISTADSALRSAFANFKAQGVTDVIVDLRYNGGGLVDTAQIFSDLLGAARSPSDVQAYQTFRASKAQYNETRLYQPEANAIAPMRIAFIGTGGTASASEYVINAAIPYFHGNAALIGTNTYGKPVGQIAIDKPACDDRFRIIAFALENASHQGTYFDGLASKMEASCKADDDIFHPLGDPNESSTRAALDFIAGRSCTRIGATAATAALRTGEGSAGARDLLMPDRPNTQQREVPGAF